MANAPSFKVLDWEDVEDAAQMAFAIWTDQPELAWARSAWDTVVLAGLATYSNELGRCRAAIRFLALASLYHDFCAIAWEERVEPDLPGWAEELCVSAFRVGQLVGDRVQQDDDYKDEAFKHGLEYLVHEARTDVLASLLAAAGDVSSLFISLWRSSKESSGPADGESADDSECEAAREIVNDVTDGKLAAFAWLDSGCEEASYAMSDEVPPDYGARQESQKQAQELLTPHPALLLIANADGTLKREEFSERGDLLDLGPPHLTPQWWPQEWDGVPLSGNERVRSFRDNLDALLSPPGSQGEEDPTTPTWTPERIVRSLLVLHSAVRQGLDRAPDYRRQGQG